MVLQFGFLVVRVFLAVPVDLALVGRLVADDAKVP